MPVAGERLGQPAHPGVDVLTAAFDEPVGVEHQGLPGLAGEGGLGEGDPLGAGAQRRCGGLVEQIAGAVLYLCSDAAAQVTGTTISVDGGWTAS